MKIQYLNGGLANQVFQHIFVRFAEITYPNSGPWFFDDSLFFVNNVHNGYELENVFGLKLNTMLGKTLVDSLKASNDPNRILINLQSTMQELLPEESFYSNSYVAKEISGLN